MRKWLARAGIGTSLLLWAAAATPAAPILAPLTTFGGGDGWIAPGERTYLSSDSTQRGLAYNPATGHLLLVSRAGGLSVRVLDGATGADVDTLQLASSMTGPGTGIFPLNMIAAGDDGAIYAANLADTVTAPFKIYRWDNESAVPSLQYNSAPGAAPRLGDTLDVRGTGIDTMLLAGVAVGSSGTAEKNGYVLFHTSGGPPYSASNVWLPTEPPHPGDFRLGITFFTGDSVIGTQGGMLNATERRPARVVTFNFDPNEPVPPALVASPLLATAGERPMDFAVIDGQPVLATVNTDTSVVRLYDISDATAPALLASLTNLAAASNANPNGVGQVRFGAIEGKQASLYVLNTNNGVQAFSVFIPEPTALMPVIVCAAGAVLRRKRALRRLRAMRARVAPGGALP